MLQRCSQYLRKKGLSATARRIVQEWTDYFRARAAIEAKPRFPNIAALTDFLFSDEARLIRPSQVREEIVALLTRVETLRPRTILEIGTNNGGTLFGWTRVAAEDAELISLDLPGGEFGGGYPTWKKPLYRSFALGSQKIHLVQGDSHAPAALAHVRALLQGRSLDFLFIDGDHTYAGVKQDYETFAPLVRPGGLVAFHDIADHGDASCDVRRYWLEVRPTRAAEEFVASPPQGWAGIGLLRQS